MTGTEWQEWLDGLPEAERDAEWCIQDCIRDYAASEDSAEARIKELRKALAGLRSVTKELMLDPRAHPARTLDILVEAEIEADAALRGDEGGKG
jgi:hypothetical protein